MPDWFRPAVTANGSITISPSLQIESIAAVKVDGQFHYFTEAAESEDRFIEESDDIYAATYESDYSPNVIDVYLL